MAMIAKTMTTPSVIQANQTKRSCLAARTKLVSNRNITIKATGNPMQNKTSKELGQARQVSAIAGGTTAIAINSDLIPNCHRFKLSRLLIPKSYPSTPQPAKSQGIKPQPRPRSCAPGHPRDPFSGDLAVLPPYEPESFSEAV